ncbi:small multi-drug export protein [Shouchella sp. JSM 1781072]|uniref:small multi-drug export protein n=1 Tax=Bacillaceae TaxID=186817 RepID=UPI0020D077F2|nr:small multi-drug export protein [Alkalihalobacillus sp. LMS6]UTR05393.1 small multi-drug export protein [Alkalihalobacillus sp. LMS6]
MMDVDFSYMLVLFIGAIIPLVEYMLAVPVGVILMGEPVVPVVIVAIIGNTLGVIGIVLLGEKIRALILRRKKDTEENKPNRRKEKTQKYLEKYGMPGVGIIGSFLLSSHLSAATAVALGVPKGLAIFWTVIGVLIWATVFGIVSVYASHWFEPFLGPQAIKE